MKIILSKQDNLKLNNCSFPSFVVIELSYSFDNENKISKKRPEFIVLSLLLLITEHSHKNLTVIAYPTVTIKHNNKLI